MVEDKEYSSVNSEPPQNDTGEKLEEVDEVVEPVRVDPVLAPDGGWGWVIVFGAFVVGILVDGCAFTFGIIMMDMADYYNVSKMSISWAGSVMNGVYLTIGPLVSGMCNKFGCRPVAMLGALIASCGIFTCIFAPTVEILILLYGFVGGFGFGMLYLPSIVMVGFYFEKKRAFATGLAVCGSGIGAFVMAPVIEKLLDIYEWRGAQIILAGVILNGIIVAVLFRPLERPSEIGIIDEESVAKSDDVELTQSSENRKRPLSIEIVLPDEAREHQFTSLSDLYVPKLRSHTQIGNAENRGERRLNYVRSCDENVFRKVEHGHLAVVDRGVLERDLLRPMSRKDIFYAGSVTNLAEYKVKGPDEYHRSMTVIHSSHLVEEPNQEKSCCTGSTSESVLSVLTEIIDLSLLRSYTFLLYGLSCFLTMAGFFVPFMFLPDDAMEKGMSRDNAAILLSLVGAANTVGRIVCGLVSDQSWADCLLINNLALIIGGAATIVVPFLDGNFALLCIYAVIFGLCIAVFVSLRSILMVELIGLEKLTSAFGMVTLCQGISSFVGAPMAGAIYDATGDYSISFYFAGSMLLLAGIVCLPCRRISLYEKQKLEKKQ